MGNTTLGFLGDGEYTEYVTLHGDGNATITDNDCSKDSSLAIMPLYLSDADGTDVFDYGGVTKTITLTGVYLNESKANIVGWIADVENLQQGHQDNDSGYPLYFNDDIRGGLWVKVLSFSSTYTEAEPTKLRWNLKLVQSSTNA